RRERRRSDRAIDGNGPEHHDSNKTERAVVCAIHDKEVASSGTGEARGGTGQPLRGREVYRTELDGGPDAKLRSSRHAIIKTNCSSRPCGLRSFFRVAWSAD